MRNVFAHMVPRVLTPRPKNKESESAMTFLNDPPKNQRVLTMLSLVTNNEYSRTTLKLKDKASVDKRSSSPPKRQACQAPR
jgi:hypothetical protein